MRWTFVSLVGVILVFICAPVRAQTGDPKRNYDFEKPLYTVVDVATKAWFSGWSGDCNSGRIPLAFQLWRIDPVTKQSAIVPVTVFTGPRPDAAKYLAAVCDRPFDNNVGWSLVPNAPEPPGQFLYAVLVTDVPSSWYCGVYPAGYPNAGQMFCDYATNEVLRIVR